MTVNGDIPGLDGALRDAMRAYEPGDVGVSRLDACVISLGFAEWAWYSWYEKGSSASITAGATGNLVVYTTPLDRLTWVDYVSILRTSGDNLVEEIQFNLPEGYFAGSEPELLALLLSTATTRAFWPDPGGVQTVGEVCPGPLLLQPGTEIRLRHDGTGVAATVFNYRIVMRQSKLVRSLLALPP